MFHACAREDIQKASEYDTGNLVARFEPDPPVQAGGISDTVAVRFHPFDDYSVHVRFDEMLSEEALGEMARLFGASLD